MSYEYLPPLNEKLVRQTGEPSGVTIQSVYIQFKWWLRRTFFSQPPLYIIHPQSKHLTKAEHFLESHSTHSSSS
jgi:hypothetical protein